MLQAMNTGHEGSLTTVHANSPRDALARMEAMAMMANLQLSEKAIRKQIASAVTLVLQVARLSDGTHKLKFLIPILVLSTSCLAQEALTIRTHGKQKPPADAQKIQLLIQPFRPQTNAGFQNLGQPFGTMMRDIDGGTATGYGPAAIQRFELSMTATEIVAW
jgi:hypothetical protein